MSRSIETLRPFAPNVTRPTARQLILHIALFVVTAATTTLSGIVWTADLGDYAPVDSAADGGVARSVLLLPWHYLSGVAILAWRALTHPALLTQGIKFSASLL